MNSARLVRRSLRHYWRTNLAIVLGVATAVAVLAGALLVGESVRGSLADLVQRRLGATDLIVSSPLYFREQLAADLLAHRRAGDGLNGVAPIIVGSAVVTEQESGRRASGVRIYGVDERFWRFHGHEPIALESREAGLSAGLARAIGATAGSAVLVRVERPSDIPLETLHSRKDDVGRTLRLTTRQILDASSLGDFSLDPGQGDVLALFVPMARLQEEMDVAGRVNTILISEAAGQSSSPDTILQGTLRDSLSPEDVGLTLKGSNDGAAVIVGSTAGLLDERQVATVQTVADAAPRTEVFTYLANSMRIGDREVPYSLVAGMPPEAVPGWTDFNTHDPGVSVIALNAWAAEELGARAGSRLTLDYYVWEEPGRLTTRSAEFVVSGVVPVDARLADLAPEYPGISNTSNLADWDPPFPLDLRRVRPVDEDYWDRYRATPKAFVPLDTAQRLWSSRYGQLTSVRIPVAASEPVTAAISRIGAQLGRSIDAVQFGLTPRPVRADALVASRGATDFGEYFVYFSFFLVISALVLVVLFFKLGVEQRGREVGLLRAVGLRPAAIRRLFAAEGLVLSILGSLLGVFGAVAYAALLIRLLTTRWVGAVGTTSLTLHVAPTSLLVGAVGGVVAAVLCIWWTLRRLGRVSERSLLAGEIALVSADGPPSRWSALAALGLAALGVLLVVLAATTRVDAAAGFFGAGAALLVSALMYAGVLLRRPHRRLIGGEGWAIPRLAARNTSYRPARSVMSMAVIASATFILVTVDTFRRDSGVDPADQSTGTGGYELMVQMLLPFAHDPNSTEGRDMMNVPGLDRSTHLEPFRVRPGDDASCLNLYQPTNPRIIAPRDSFLNEGRFTFQSAAATTGAEAANPWLLLNRTEPDGAIPVIGDANSMTYVLHRAVGDEFVLTSTGSPVTLRFVGALRDSIFQSELLMSEANFRRLFPERSGYQLLLVDTPAGAVDVSQQLEQGLSDAGADAIQTTDYLASFHRVENTYLSTFQTLGGLGLLLGTAGLATVLLRNVLERRREFALLAAVGYRRSHFIAMAALENIALVLGGLLTGAVCAAIAMAPTVAERGARLPLSSGAWLLLFAVFVVAILSTLAAMAAATRTPLLEALRSE